MIHDKRKQANKALRSRDDNPIIFLEIFAGGGYRHVLTGKVSEPRILGRMYFELRQDIAPYTCSNFITLISGSRGLGQDGINYTYKGTKIHRVCKNFLFQGGDLLGMNGNCSKSIFNNGGYFNDENFILRHTGPGVLSMCNQGPNTNGSLFQVSMIENPDMDDRYVVFGCMVGEESFEVLNAINILGSLWGRPIEEVHISDCGIIYPKTRARPSQTKP